MSNSYGSNVAQVISPSDLADLCPATYERFMGVIKEKYSTHWDGEPFDGFTEIARLIQNDELVDDCDEGLTQENINLIMSALSDLQDDFSEKTKVGDSSLTLHLGHHDSSAIGDRDDDINGATWFVGGVYQKTPAAEKLAEKIVDVGFVTYL